VETFLRASLNWVQKKSSKKDIPSKTIPSRKATPIDPKDN
jgi:hypothetical protein